MTRSTPTSTKSVLPVGASEGTRICSLLPSAVTHQSWFLTNGVPGNLSIYDFASHVRIGDPIPINVFTPRGTSIRSDGMAVAIGDGNGIAIWDLNPEHLKVAACRLAGRNLTPTEWNTHLHDLGDYRPTCARYP
jgi:hypothetical protein